LDLASHLNHFADICQNSEEDQGDGWGISYWDEATADWKLYKSLTPIWEDKASFSLLPESRLVVAHARSAFGSESIAIENNQPYLKDRWSFVFNGTIYQVKIRIYGQIGAHKIFNLILRNLESDPPVAAISRAVSLLERKSESREGINLILSDREHLYVSCNHWTRAEYFTLRYHTSDDLTIVCSESYPGCDFLPMSNHQLLVF